MLRRQLNDRFKRDNDSRAQSIDPVARRSFFVASLLPDASEVRAKMAIESVERRTAVSFMEFRNSEIRNQKKSWDCAD